MTLTETLDHLLSVFLRPLRTWIEREVVAPLRSAYDAAMQTKEQYRDGVYLHLRERLEGTDEHPLAEGVPVRPLPATQDLAHLQAAVELLDTRKVDTGSLTDGIPDGVSLVRLLCDSSLASQVTELVDTNNGWTCRTKIPLSQWDNLISLSLNCIGELAYGRIGGSSSLRILIIPYVSSLIRYNNNIYAIGDMTSLQEIYAPSVTNAVKESSNYAVVYNCKSVKKIVLGKLERMEGQFTEEMYRLIHFEIGINSECAMYLGWWQPTMALRTDTTASDYIDLREDKDDSGEFIYQNNLQQFLSNFKNYIADRLADRTGKETLTLTLSQAIRDVLTAEIEDIIVSQKHWVISPAKSV